MEMTKLEDLLEHMIQDLYSAETQIVEALPMMAEKATNPQLKMAFEKHLRESQEQAQRLERVAQMLGVDPNGETCVAMESLIDENEDMMDQDMTPEVCDAALIAGAQKVEHYEIAGYGTAITWCRQLGQDEACELLEQTLNEEKTTDENLTTIAEGGVNQMAEQGQGAGMTSRDGSRGMGMGSSNMDMSDSMRSNDSMGGQAEMASDSMQRMGGRDSGSGL